MKKKIALITGATSGIGKACAIALAKSGYDIIACGRREERLVELRGQLSDDTGYTYLVFDVSKRDEVRTAFESLDDKWKNIDLLINNAGNAHGLSPIQTGDIDDWDAMMDINVKGLLYVFKQVMPQMIERRSGQIINIGSIAGKEVYPNGKI